MIKIFCDGACLGPAGSPGAWAMQVHYTNGVIAEMGEPIEETTNNRAELTAVINAAKHLREGEATEAIIYSDSRYVVDNLVNNLKSWIERDYRNVMNDDLWREMATLNPWKYKWQWIKGHHGQNAVTDEENFLHEAQERVDQLANHLARRKPVSFFFGKPDEKANRGNYPCYIVVHNLKFQRFDQWDRCRQYVEGKKNIKFKKVKSFLEEQEVLRKWGIKI
jgi:ribonuclease HI